MSPLKTLLAAGIGVATLALGAGAAFADPGQATASVNVRSGPGTTYRVVDTLYAGEDVDIGNCQGSWCYVTHNGPAGWVSANYLTGGDDEAAPPVYYDEPDYYDQPDYYPAPIYVPTPVYPPHHHRPPFHFPPGHKPPPGKPWPGHPWPGHPWPGKPGNNTPSNTPQVTPQVNPQPHVTIPGTGPHVGNFPHTGTFPHAGTPGGFPHPNFTPQPRTQSSGGGGQNICQINPEVCQPHQGHRGR